MDPFVLLMCGCDLVWLCETFDRLEDCFVSLTGII